jgi:shikimate dehydrogenase
MKIDGKTKLFCVIGDPIEHTLSPAMHNAVFEELGLNCVYTAFRIEPVALGDFVRGAKAMDLGGVNVTIPHKVAVIEHLDELSEEARIIGAVNTIKMGEKLVGYNTDGRGAMRALIQGGADPKNKDVLILGSGGAARALGVTLALRAGISSLTILGIVEEELKKLAGDITSGTGVEVSWRLMNDETKVKLVGDADIVIHSTPVGMAPKDDQAILTAEEIPSDIKLMDIVYTPLETRLMKEAKKAGVKTIIGGLEMFVNQGAEAEGLWLDIEPPVELMRKVVLGKLRG